MPDPNIAPAAIQSHTKALESALKRHVTNAGRCKVWSGAIVAGMLLLAAGKAQMAALPWAAGVVVLLALADAGQVAMARVFTVAYNRFMQKLPLNGGNAMKAEEFMLPAPVLGWRETGQVVGALGSFSVWPFYGALLALVAVFYVQSSQTEKGSARLLPSSATNPAKSASGNTKASVPVSVGPPASSRPSQPLPTGNAQLPAPLPRRNVIPQLPNRPTQFPNPAVRPVTGTPQPGQSPPYSPIPASPAQPGVQPVPTVPTGPPAPTVPTVPGAPARVPQNTSPGQTQPIGVTPAPQTPASGQSPSLPPTNSNAPTSPDAPR